MKASITPLDFYMTKVKSLSRRDPRYLETLELAAQQMAEELIRLYREKWELTERSLNESKIQEEFQSGCG